MSDQDSDICSETCLEFLKKASLQLLFVYKQDFVIISDISLDIPRNFSSSLFLVLIF